MQLQEPRRAVMTVFAGGAIGRQALPALQQRLAHVAILFSPPNRVQPLFARISHIGFCTIVEDARGGAQSDAAVGLLARSCERKGADLGGVLALRPAPLAQDLGEECVELGGLARPIPLLCLSKILF